ncbi:putative MATE family efflux protein [Trueperella bonasi]|uniref:MATE family efflux protein n=1 Tax=Trueperella bonasi TaxID=312286 RepID=A0ABT9NG39_9ACTO|nr:MATE family efflux transporter [Trueperella bonasi]MDP9806366.1 putative MATE family efflux protein [Trueperella bonasi]
MTERDIDRSIRKLALPSLATLLAEPLLIAVDTTMVGRLGTHPLAGLSLASTVLATVVGICIFLSYATTAATARHVGSGHPDRGLRQGIDGMWLGLSLGVVLGMLLAAFAPTILGWFGPEPEVLAEAVRYARASAVGLPGMLLVLAANGTLRGFADTRTPLIAATTGALVNIPLNAALIYGAKLGVAGAGLGTAIAQTFMGAYLGYTVYRLARTHAVALRPSGAGVLKSLRDAIPLVIRTLSLRGAIILQISAATSLGTLALATNQIVMTMWNFAAFGLDALATAAQILVGQGLGSGSRERVRLVLKRNLVVGVRIGVVLGVLLAGLSFVIPHVMTIDDDVAWLATQAMWVTSAALPIAAVAYMLDGVLIGAGDTKRLAWYMVGALIAFTPVALFFIGPGAGWGAAGMIWLWVGYAVLFMAVRGGTMLWRVRKDEWMSLDT